jgi:hypothetical protein
VISICNTVGLQRLMTTQCWLEETQCSFFCGNFLSRQLDSIKSSFALNVKHNMTG